MTASIPTKLQGVLWSRDIAHLDLKKDKIYIIHQILSHGRMEDFRWLLQAYPREEIKEVFITHPYKDYDAVRFHFVTYFLLDLREKSLEEKQYVTTIPRHLG